MTLLPITLFEAAAIGTIDLWLGLRIFRMRLRDSVLIGDGGGDLLEGRMRAHANLVEYAPFVLVLMALIELAGGSTTALAVAGIVFVAARIAHPIGMDRRTSNVPRGRRGADLAGPRLPDRLGRAGGAGAGLIYRAVGQLDR